MAKKEEHPLTKNFPKMSQPAVRALATAGYTHLEQLDGVSGKEILNLHGMGPKAFKILPQTSKIFLFSGRLSDQMSQLKHRDIFQPMLFPVFQFADNS